MIRLLAHAFLLLAVMIGLMVGLVYAPDYFNYQPYETTYTTPTGVPYADPLEVADTEVVFVMYWFADCKWCVEQREALRHFIHEHDPNGQMTIVYVNAMDDLQTVLDYIARIDPPMLEGVEERWLLCSEPFMGQYPTVKVYVQGEFVVEWNTYYSYDTIVELFFEESE